MDSIISRNESPLFTFVAASIAVQFYSSGLRLFLVFLELKSWYLSLFDFICGNVGVRSSLRVVFEQLQAA